MELKELQTQVQTFDRVRGWHQVAPAHIGLHLLEELGEIARELRRREGYKEGEGQLDQELADILILIAKLANRLDINLEQAVRDKLAEIDLRFPLDRAQAAINHQGVAVGHSRSAANLYNAVQKGRNED